jgi:protein-S-isoprenylcysteine O-methyltransferase Ste14
VNTSPENIVQSAWLVWVLSWLAAAVWTSPTERRPHRRDETTYRLVTASGAVLLFGLYRRWVPVDIVVWRPGGDPAWMLVAITVCGFLFTWWARIVLGRLWSGSVTQKIDHYIVNTGPYRLVRHPIYSGIILAVSATAVLRGTLAAYLGAALIALGLFIKARIEEGFLREKLGEDQYNAYARRVPMLIPFRLLR